MAIGAAHHALLDFGLQSAQRDRTADHAADATALFPVHVIEVEHDNGPFVAIDAALFFRPRRRKKDGPAQWRNRLRVWGG
jgi:hypothetical protein